MKVHLTKTLVESLDQPGDYRDDTIKGLLVRVSIDKRTGEVRRVFRLNARIKGGKVVTTTLGPYGAPGISGVFTVEQAKKWAQETIRDMRGYAGNETVNPNEKIRQQAAQERERAEAQALQDDLDSYTLRVALDGYLKLRASTGRKQKGELTPRTAELYRQCIHKHLADWLDQPLRIINKDMVSERYVALCSHSVAAAGNTFRALRAIINYTIEIKNGRILSANPVTVLSALKQWKPVEPRDERVSDTQIATWWEAVCSLENQEQADFFKLLLLTGFRKNELASMQWADVDFDNRYWTARNTKNGRDHIMPFTLEVERILKSRRANAYSEYLFPGRGPRGYVSHVEHVQGIIQQATGISFTPHALRRTFNSIAIRLVPSYIAKEFMNHRDNSDVTQRHYNRLEVETLRPLLQKVEDEILKLAGLKKIQTAKRKTG